LLCIQSSNTEGESLPCCTLIFILMMQSQRKEAII
jgi:hypothetical protein